MATLAQLKRDANRGKMSVWRFGKNGNAIPREFRGVRKVFRANSVGLVLELEMGRCPIGNDYPVFQEIVTYVRDKSFILFSGEGQEAWKWFFENGKCRKVVPQIIWGE